MAEDEKAPPGGVAEVPVEKDIMKVLSQISEESAQKILGIIKAEGVLMACHWKCNVKNHGSFPPL